MTVNINDILSKNVEGFNAEMYNREKTKIKNSLAKDCGEIMYSLQ